MAFAMDLLGHMCDKYDEKPGTQSSYHELYKKRSGLSQEERRRRTLEAQKKKRNELFDLNRHIQFVEDEQSESMLEEKMEVGQSPSQSKRRGGICKMLMFSEWMTEIPEDLQSNWYFVPSPVGRRCVLKAHKGVTKIFTKWGKFLKRFQSALPSGCRREYKYGPTILDCIWSELKSICYVLDVIFWKGQSFIDCEAEFRFYWLKTKFEETPELQVITAQNQTQLQVLPSCLYSPSDLASEVGINSAWATNSTSLDGILFYHQKGHYYSGEVTPLVEWLKPFMLPEILGVEVPDVYLQERPDNYVSMEQYIAEEALKKKQYHRRKNHMEVDEDAAVVEEDMKDGCSIQEEMESISGVDAPIKCEIGEETYLGEEKSVVYENAPGILK